MVYDPISFRTIQMALGDAVGAVRGDRLYNAVLEMYGQGKAKGAFPISPDVAVALCDAEQLHGLPLLDEHVDRPYRPQEDVYRAVWADKAALPAGYEWVSADCHLTPDDQHSDVGPPDGQPELDAASEGSSMDWMADPRIFDSPENSDATSQEATEDREPSAPSDLTGGGGGNDDRSRLDTAGGTVGLQRELSSSGGVSSSSAPLVPFAGAAAGFSAGAAASSAPPGPFAGAAPSSTAAAPALGDLSCFAARPTGPQPPPPKQRSLFDPDHPFADDAQT